MKKILIIAAAVFLSAMCIRAARSVGWDDWNEGRGYGALYSASLEETRLDGKWKGKCIPSPGESESDVYIFTFRESDNTLEMEEYFYDGTAHKDRAKYRAYGNGDGGTLYITFLTGFLKDEEASAKYSFKDGFLAIHIGEDIYLLSKEERPAPVVSKKELVGKWAMGGYGVGYSGGYGDVLVLTLGKDGNAVAERTEGCMLTNEALTWNTDGKSLCLLPVEKPKREVRGGGYTHSVDGVKYRVNSWPENGITYEISYLDGGVLHLRHKDETMALNSRKAGDRS